MSQGIQAQTLANFGLAQEAGLSVIPVVTKVDLPGAQPEEVRGACITDTTLPHTLPHTHTHTHMHTHMHTHTHIHAFTPPCARVKVQ